MFIEDEIITLKSGGEFKILSVSFKDMKVYVQSLAYLGGERIFITINWEDIEVNENKAIAIKEYKRRRQIDKLLE